MYKAELLQKYSNAAFVDVTNGILKNATISVHNKN